MRRQYYFSTRCLFVLCASALSLAAAPREAAEVDDLKRMQGDWMVVSMAANGMKYPDEEAQALQSARHGGDRWGDGMAL